jgi:hypothetical protein
MMPMQEIIPRAKKTLRWPTLSMAGPAEKQPMHLPMKGREDTSDVCVEPKAYDLVFEL